MWSKDRVSNGDSWDIVIVGGASLQECWYFLYIEIFSKAERLYSTLEETFGLSRVVKKLDKDNRGKLRRITDFKTSTSLVFEHSER